MNPYWSRTKIAPSGLPQRIEVRPLGSWGPVLGDVGVASYLCSLSGLMGLVSYLSNRVLFHGQWEVRVLGVQGRGEEIQLYRRFPDRISAMCFAQALVGDPVVRRNGGNGCGEPVEGVVVDGPLAGQGVDGEATLSD